EPDEGVQRQGERQEGGRTQAIHECLPIREGRRAEKARGGSGGPEEVAVAVPKPPAAIVNEQWFCSTRSQRIDGCRGCPTLDRSETSVPDGRGWRATRW